MDDNIIFKDNNILITNTAIKFEDTTYSLGLLEKTEIEFYPIAKEKLFLLIGLGALYIVINKLLDLNSKLLLIGILIIVFALYRIIKEEYTLKIYLLNNKPISTIISKDTAYLEQVDNAIQSALDNQLS